MWRVSEACLMSFLTFISCISYVPVWWPGNENSPTVTHACCNRRLKWVATLPLGDINTEDWASGMGVGSGGYQPCPVKKKIVEKPPQNSAGFCWGGQSLSWAVEPRKEEEEEEDFLYRPTFKFDILLGQTEKSFDSFPVKWQPWSSPELPLT
jgi:hypothetical protein